MVKSVKSLIKKYHRSNQEISKGLLILRNTPVHCGKSPAQLLFGHSLRDNVPRLTEMKSNVTRDIRKERFSSKEYHDRQTPQQTRFRHYFIAIQDDVTKEWSKRGRIVEEVAPRSYTVKMLSGKVLRRNT